MRRVKGQQGAGRRWPLSDAVPMEAGWPIWMVNVSFGEDLNETRELQWDTGSVPLWVVSEPGLCCLTTNPQTPPDCSQCADDGKLGVPPSGPFLGPYYQAYGAGQVQGNVHRTWVEVGDSIVIAPVLFANVTSFPPYFFLNDWVGIFGAGCPNAESSGMNGLNVILAMMEQGLLADPLFSIAYQGDDMAEVVLGGVEHSAYTGALTFVPVPDNKESHWTFFPDAIWLASDPASAELGPQTVIPGAAGVVMDSGFAAIDISDEVMYKAWLGEVTAAAGDNYSMEAILDTYVAPVIPCNIATQMPSLGFTIQGVNFTVDGADQAIPYEEVKLYSNPNLPESPPGMCFLQVINLQLPTPLKILFGVPFLRKYYTVFNVIDKSSNGCSLGFATRAP
jgi:hypothetical protein